MLQLIAATTRVRAFSPQRLGVFFGRRNGIGEDIDGEGKQEKDKSQEEERVVVVAAYGGFAELGGEGGREGAYRG
jgi:hypothetical protein